MNITMNSLKIEDGKILDGFIDIHIHTSPDVKPRVLTDYEAALESKKGECEP